ncbi:hypothetical protein [Arthrobacter sp. A2-55]|uniref:hypothetical protein n=1 Tax=Arthrobacter sp. A2-55 TaxID=2897337 RepID=UPI0021CD8D2D|nr:hypothetical protein [Arthrobacter sp. A2-55]MCU6480158.1 hypothetical protein [Arthrobacter sp. A2-55]
MSTQSSTLTRIAHLQAERGHGWEALIAQLAADAHVLGEVMDDHPKALVDIGPLRSLDLKTGHLREALEGSRDLLCQALEPAGLAGTFRRRLDGLPEANPSLNDTGSDEFARSWLDGDTPDAAAARLRRKAGRLYALARRLDAGADRDGAVRSVTMAARTCFAAHHLGDSNPNDADLSMLRAALLLAEDRLESFRFPEDGGLNIDSLHDLLDQATLAPTPVPWP